MFYYFEHKNDIMINVKLSVGLPAKGKGILSRDKILSRQIASYNPSLICAFPAYEDNEKELKL